MQLTHQNPFTQIVPYAQILIAKLLHNTASAALSLRRTGAALLTLCVGDTPSLVTEALTQATLTHILFTGIRARFSGRRSMNRYERIEQTKENYRAKLPKPDPAWPRRVRQAVAFIILHLFDPRLTVTWMKKECSIHSHSFAGRFRYYMGRPPKEYILKHRIAIAKQFLTDEMLADNHIIDVALSTGFNSHAAFTMEFKRYVGCTPGVFRRKYRGA